MTMDLLNRVALSVGYIMIGTYIGKGLRWLWFAVMTPTWEECQR